MSRSVDAVKVRDSLETAQGKGEKNSPEGPIHIRELIS